MGRYWQTQIKCGPRKPDGKLAATFSQKKQTNRTEDISHCAFLYKQLLNSLFSNKNYYLIKTEANQVTHWIDYT